MSDIIYAYDYEQEQVIYREPGKRRGDGQIDSDESPVWLVAHNQDCLILVGPEGERLSETFDQLDHAISTARGIGYDVLVEFPDGSNDCVFENRDA